MSELFSIFTNPISLITFTISICIIFTLTFHFSSVLARRKRKGNKKSAPQSEEVIAHTLPEEAGSKQATQYPVFLDAQNVSAIRDFANQDFYAVLLTALDQALQKNGYEMTRDKSRETVLPLVVECGVIRDVSAARVGYITPRLNEEAKKKSIQSYIDDGYGDCFVMTLQEGAKAQGWYIARIDDEQGETVCEP